MICLFCPNLDKIKRKANNFGRLDVLVRDKMAADALALQLGLQFYKHLDMCSAFQM